MNVAAAHLGLNIDSPLVVHSAPNFRPPSWPPPDEFPVVIDAQGNVISRYGDDRWDLSLWAKRPLRINFGDGPQRKNDPVISPANAAVLRQIVGWWLWGPRSVTSPVTLFSQVNWIRPIFILCSMEGICASDLARFPAVADLLPKLLYPTRAGDVLRLLHVLLEQSDQIGFVLLDSVGLRRLEANLPEDRHRQTPYIPARIWLYQVNRLRAFLDDFQSHREGLEACYRFCLDAYATNFGSLAEACRTDRIGGRLPFSAPQDRTGSFTGARYHGPFQLTAERFGIAGLLERWCLLPDESLGERTVNVLETLLTMATRVAMAYLLNFSMMRIYEGWSLHTDCLEIEQDETFGSIYMLRGVTTKTIEDDDARWVTSPSAKVAVEVASCVARLRMIAAEANPEVPTTPDQLRNPPLVLRPYEPWANSKNVDHDLSIRPQYPSYREMAKYHPRLFNLDELRITAADLQIARLITPDLDSEAHAVGRIWPLAWHQLRRTGAVNMQSSGLVSDASVQYQLKHATRAMSLYYGQGRAHVSLNKSAQTEYVRTIYELLGKEVAHLFADRFVSPYGADHKSQILKMVAPKDAAQLSIAARAGKVAWRENLLGGCTKRGPCEYGGVDNVVRCGGGDGRAPCAEALFDRRREPAIRQLGREITERLNDAPEGSPYRESLKAQQRAVENALDVIANQ